MKKRAFIIRTSGRRNIVIQVGGDATIVVGSSVVVGSSGATIMNRREKTRPDAEAANRGREKQRRQ